MTPRCSIASQLILLSVAALVTTATVRAESEAGVTLVVDSCVEADAALIRRHFFVELGSAAHSTDGAQAHAELNCDGDLIVLRVNDLVTGKSLTRRIASGARKGRERLLALAVMELLVASWIELETEPMVPPANTVRNERATANARRVVRSRLLRSAWATTVAVGPLVRAWAGGAAYGGSVRLMREHRSGLGFTIDMGASQRHDEQELGDVSLSLIDVASIAHGVLPFGRLRLRGGLGGRLGYAIIDGRATDPAVARGGRVTGALFGGLARVEAEVELLMELRALASFDAGYALRGVRGRVTDGQDSALAGGWLTAQLAVGWSW